MCFEDLGQVKLSAMIESQDSSPISSERLIGSRGSNNVQVVPISSEWDSRTNGADTDERFEDVCHGYESERFVWKEYAAWLTFDINTEQDCVRGNTPFYLIHGWDPRSTLESTFPLGSTKLRDWKPRRWRYHIQLHYQRAREAVNDRPRIAIRIGLIDTTLRKDRMRSKLDRKYGSIWIG